MYNLYILAYSFTTNQQITSTAPIVRYYDCPIDPTDLINCTFNFTSTDDKVCGSHSNDVLLQCNSGELLPHAIAWYRNEFNLGRTYLFNAYDEVKIYIYENIIPDDEEVDGDIIGYTEVLTVEYRSKDDDVPVCKDAIGQVEAQLICTHRYGGYGKCARLP